jgi:hypothetical protein
VPTPHDKVVSAAAARVAVAPPPRRRLLRSLFALDWGAAGARLRTRVRSHCRFRNRGARPARGCGLGFGRIVGSEIEAPNKLANLV